MITSSYISPDMENMHEEVRAKGLIFLNECGLDPGIDIMGTMKIVHEAEKAGYKVTSYESYCGGLPVADQADNPLGYKFSWNPGAAIKASRNRATFLQDSKVVVTDTPLKCAVNRDDFSVSMKLESYPNRDSLVFQKRFAMNDCRTFIRGTLRFTGFSSIISAFHDIGLTSDDPVPENVNTLRELLESRVAKNEPVQTNVNMDDEDKQLFEKALGGVDFSHLKDSQAAIKSLMKTFKFLGFFDKEHTVTVKENDKARSFIDVVGDTMAKKLALSDDDRDLVVMRHVFKIQDPQDGKEWEHTSTMVASGQSKNQKGHSIMS